MKLLLVKLVKIDPIKIKMTLHGNENSEKYIANNCSCVVTVQIDTFIEVY